MKKKLFTIVTFTAALLIAACVPFAMGDENLSRITINTGSRATVSDVSSFVLMVEASDMGTIRKSFAGSTISLDVASGEARTFTLKAFDSDGNELFAGSTTVDLMAGASLSVVIAMNVVVYSVGDIGPGGGYIFYDKGAYSDNWRYMEAYPVDLGTAVYGVNGNGTDVTATLSAIGEGLTNTALIVSQRIADGDTGTAAQICDSAAGYGYSDWFLPSYGELALMYSELHTNSLGAFAAGLYWSSSDTENDDCAWALDFSTGSGSSSPNWHSNGGYVRPARRF